MMHKKFLRTFSIGCLGLAFGGGSVTSASLVDQEQILTARKTVFEQSKHANRESIIQVNMYLQQKVIMCDKCPDWTSVYDFHDHTWDKGLECPFNRSLLAKIEDIDMNLKRLAKK